jgi:hypothetical protein
MKLHPFRATGIRAYCSDVIVDPDELDTVYFMSIAGYQTTVKGIIANFLENYGLRIDIDGDLHNLNRSDQGYKVQTKKLPSGLVHAVLFPKLALPKNGEEDENSFYIFTGKDGDIFPLFFRHLNEKSNVPMHPSWARWLWRLFKKQEWLLELATLAGAYKGYSFMFNPEKLHDLVSDAIQNKKPEIINCMQCKGGDAHGKCDVS